MYWLEFFISAAIIVFAGIRLTTYADIISDERQLGKVWIGIILLGLVTSLPEAVTSLVSILSLGANDLAIGNLLGSNNINPMLIVVMDIMYRRGSVTNAIDPNPSHKVSAYFAIGLALIVIFDIVFSGLFPAIHLGPLSVGSVLIAVCYFAGMNRLARLSPGRSVIAPGMDPAGAGKISIFSLWLKLLLSALLVIAGAIWLAQSADAIARQTGLGGTFFGAVFLAFVTSLPEMVVSLAALKLGSLDLAIGNIFGSNMTNMFIVFVCGLFHPEGPILGTVSAAHIVTALLSIVLTYIALKGIIHRNKKTVWGLGWDSLVMIVVFAIGTSILYQLRLL